MRLFDEPASTITDPYLLRAYALAEKGRGTTHPNPVVGCVIVKDDSVIGEGFHAAAGGPHAEIVALEDAGQKAAGSTVYVTLEPCNHTGKTPPCTEALIAAMVDRVVIGCADPNPGVTGRGADTLREAGIDVVVAENPEPFESQNVDWRSWVATGRPWVTLKTALSLDGRATSSRDIRTTITGAEARDLTMLLRKRATGVAIGAHTALVDRARLDLEGAYLVSAQPVRIIISRGVGTSSGGIASTLGDDSSREWLIVVPDDPDDASIALPSNIDVVTYNGDDGLSGALGALGQTGIVHLLVEAGPSLFTSFWDEDLIDELVLYHAGGVLGPHTPDTYGTTGQQELTLDRRFVIAEAGIAGDDAVTVWRPRSRSAA